MKEQKEVNKKRGRPPLNKGGSNTARIKQFSLGIGIADRLEAARDKLSKDVGFEVNRQQFMSSLLNKWEEARMTGFKDS
tara:strand:+ start:289 stop:525 length:237 start_codon:yes stop_codon:yes gene_type:complete